MTTRCGSQLAYNVAPKVGGCVLLSKEKYNNLFKEKNRISVTAKKSHQVEWETEEYVVYNVNHYKRKTNIFDKEICDSIINELGKEIQSIQEVPFSYLGGVKGGKILNNLFEKYFGDNIIIPYDLEERKKLYSLAFEELKDYMKDYDKK